MDSKAVKITGALPGLKDCWRSSSNPLIVAAWLGQVTPIPRLQNFLKHAHVIYNDKPNGVSMRYKSVVSIASCNIYGGLTMPHLSSFSKLLCLTQWCHHKRLAPRGESGLPRSRLHHFYCIRKSKHISAI